MAFGCFCMLYCNVLYIIPLEQYRGSCACNVIATAANRCLHPQNWRVQMDTSWRSHRGSLNRSLGLEFGQRYAYNNMYSDGWGLHRRRRIGAYTDMQYCIVTAEGSRNGAMMACEQCFRLYGPALGSKALALDSGYAQCPSASSCQTPGGCRYTTPQSFNRSSTAHLPHSFAERR